MRILFYNGYGIRMFVAGLGIFTLAIVAGVPLGVGWLSIYLAGCFWLVSDLWLRRRNGRRWFYDLAGGHLYFIPIWIYGVITIVGGAYLQRAELDDERQKAAAQKQIEEHVRQIRAHVTTMPTTVPDNSPSTSVQ